MEIDNSDLFEKNSSLEEVIQDAIYQVDRLKQPDLDLFKRMITPILEAAEIGISVNDEIRYLYYTTAGLQIGTRYSVRCCEQTDDAIILMSIIKASDPIKAARKYAKTKAIEYAEQQLKSAKNMYDLYAVDLVKTIDKYKDIE